MSFIRILRFLGKRFILLFFCNILHIDLTYVHLFILMYVYIYINTYISIYLCPLPIFLNHERCVTTDLFSWAWNMCFSSAVFKNKINNQSTNKICPVTKLIIPSWILLFMESPCLKHFLKSKVVQYKIECSSFPDQLFTCL